ncbi:MAG: STAS domain-containing protein [bacterium]|nr:STAS domain-containing protein [bacterium]
MKIKETKLGLISILSLVGPLVEEHTGLLRERLERCLNSGDIRVLIDLKEVPLIDSAGLELLWDALMKFRKVNGSLKLAQASPLVMDILLATRMSNTFEIFSDQEKAYRSFL